MGATGVTFWPGLCPFSRNVEKWGTRWAASCDKLSRQPKDAPHATEYQGPLISVSSPIAFASYRRASCAPNCLSSVTDLLAPLCIDTWACGLFRTAYRESGAGRAGTLGVGLDRLLSCLEPGTGRVRVALQMLAVGTGIGSASDERVAWPACLARAIGSGVRHGIKPHCVNWPRYECGRHPAGDAMVCGSLA